MNPEPRDTDERTQACSECGSVNGVAFDGDDEAVCPEPHGETVHPPYPAYVEYTVRCNVENEIEFQSIREGIGKAARSWSTLRLHGDEAAVQVLYRKRPGVRPIASDPQEPPPFTFERAVLSGSTEEGSDG